MILNLSPGQSSFPAGLPLHYVLDDITLRGQALLPRHISLKCVFPVASLGDKWLKPEALNHLIQEDETGILWYLVGLKPIRFH